MRSPHSLTISGNFSSYPPLGSWLSITQTRYSGPIHWPDGLWIPTEPDHRATTVYCTEERGIQAFSSFLYHANGMFPAEPAFRISFLHKSPTRQGSEGMHALHLRTIFKDCPPDHCGPGEFGDFSTVDSHCESRSAWVLQL